MIKKLYPILLIFFISHLYGNVPELSDKTALLQTDRFCYVSGDYVFLKTYHKLSESKVDLNESVLYVDIVDTDSQFFAGEIFKLENGMASGYIQIPDTVKTGYYFLRTYTYGSINSSSKKIISSKQIYISNRFGNNSERFEGDTNSLDALNDSITFKNLFNENCEMLLNDTLFKKRSKVSATIKISDKLIGNTLWAALSVKPISPCELQMANANEILAQSINSNGISITQNNIVSENKGMIISGHVTHNITGNPLSNILVLCAFEDSIIRLKYSISDNSGKFKFLLSDCYDKQVIYLSAYSYPSLKLYLPANLALESKFLEKETTKTEAKKVVGYESSSDSVNILKSIIAKAYGIDYVEVQQNSNRSEESFEQLYMAGEFTKTVMIDDYIDLPDFIQITREILPFVRLRKNDNKYFFSVVDGKNDIIHENPLVLVDGVPLTDINTILSWGTSKIKMVQLQTEPRFFGDVAFNNGILLIWTKKMDFWSKVENANTSAFSIPCFQKPIKFSFPDYAKENDISQPDFRQLLFWEPSISIDNSESKTFDFYTSDEEGVFELLLQGVTSSGNSVLIRKYIQVK